MSKLEKTPTGPFNPFYGCAILAIMVLTIVGIISWMFYSLLQQDREIASFAADSAPPFPAVTLTAEDKAALLGKLSAFAKAAADGPSATVSLSIGELNGLLALAADAHLGEEKGGTPYLDMLRFSGLDAATKILRADIHLPVNRLPWLGEGRRFVIGSALFKPAVENNSFDLKIDELKVPGKPVSEGFVNNLRLMPWLSVAKLKPEIAAPLSKVTSFEISPDGTTLTLKTGK